MARERYPRYALDKDGMWVVLPLGESWDSYVRFVGQDGHPVVAELRVLPRTDTPGVLAHHDKHADRWISITRGETPEQSTPKGGLTTRALRDVQLGHAVQLAYTQLGRWFDRDRRHPGSVMPTSFTATAVDTPRRPGRKGREDSFYVVAAAAYVDALEQGNRKPVVTAAQTLSETWGGTYEPTYVRDLLHVARERGLLTRPPRGRAGGQLTDRARALLQREDNQ